MNNLAIIYALVLAAFTVACSVCWAMEFRPPDLAERLRAIGPTEELPSVLRVALDPADDFEPIPAPKPGDWLAEHPESGQTFMDFINSARNTPDSERNTIYLQPLGEFDEDRSPSLKMLEEYTATYFAMTVKTLAPVNIQSAGLTTRVNPYTGNRQLLTIDILAIIKSRLPGDAFCVLGITMEDLYPDPSWNFVFGQASFRHRVGVFSFARYDPAFYGEQRRRGYRELLLRRSCRVLSHELCHMFSLAHCIFFRCALNGSNHLQESDARPLSLCPVCLRKVQHTIGFDVVERYRKLLRFYRKVGFDEEALWTANRLDRILGKPRIRTPNNAPSRLIPNTKVLR